MEPSRVLPPTEEEWVAFLQWCLPRLGMRWEGFRNPRRQVSRRIWQRIEELGLSGLAAYQARLERDPLEWRVLDTLCRVTISRFFRDKGLFEALRRLVLPKMAERAERAGEPLVRAWSIGCASGEEPYTLELLWRLDVQPAHPSVRLAVVGTDIDEHVLRRAEIARYPKSSIKELPDRYRKVFAEAGDEVFLPQPYMEGVELHLQDVRDAAPPGRFQLILCRNVAFTYFSETVQRTVLRRLVESLEPAGFLVIGAHEHLPAASEGVQPTAMAGIYEKPSSLTRALFPGSVLRPWLR